MIGSVCVDGITGGTDTAGQQEISASCESDDQNVANDKDVFTLKGSLGYVRPRPEDTTVRWPSFKQEQDSELYYSSHLTLFRPRRDETDLANGIGSHQVRCQADVEEISGVEAKYVHSTTADLRRVMNALNENGPPKSSVCLL